MSIAIFDFAFFANLTDNDLEMQRELLKIFILQNDNDIEIMQDYLHRKHYVNWLKIVHKIYGSAANMGAIQIAHTCNIAQCFAASEIVQIKQYNAMIVVQYQQLKQTISQYLEL